MDTKKLITEIFNRPTAPFKEHFVQSKISEILTKNNIPYFKDSFGNLIAGVSSAQKLWKKPYLVYIAHTDHPGFHIVKSLGKNKYSALWFGGAPFKQMSGKKVKIYSHLSGKPRIGKIISINFAEYKRTGLDMVIESKSKLEPGDFGSFHCPACLISGDKVTTRAADDLAGCVMALGALIDLKKKGLPVISIFTRAEEVGFIGCIALLENKILNSKFARVISLEASRTLPGALIGEGPVVRLGDASSIFNSKLNRFVSMIAGQLKKSDNRFNFQKRIMDGGSCEATAFDVYGFQTMGISVPLGNYHNQGKRGPAPEIISIRDVDNGRKLLTEIALNNKKIEFATNDVHKRLKKQYLELKPNLTKNMELFR